MHPWEVLDIEQTSDKETIKVAFRKKSLLHHPDKGGSKKDFLRLEEAYQIMMYGYDEYCNSHDWEDVINDIRNEQRKKTPSPQPLLNSSPPINSGDIRDKQWTKSPSPKQSLNSSPPINAGDIIDISSDEELDSMDGTLEDEPPSPTPSLHPSANIAHEEPSTSDYTASDTISFDRMSACNEFSDNDNNSINESLVAISQESPIVKGEEPQTSTSGYRPVIESDNGNTPNLPGSSQMQANEGIKDESSASCNIDRRLTNIEGILQSILARFSDFQTVQDLTAENFSLTLQRQYYFIIPV